MDSFPAAVTQQPPLITLKIFMEIYGLSPKKIWLRFKGSMMVDNQGAGKLQQIILLTIQLRLCTRICINTHPEANQRWILEGQFFFLICNLKVSAIWVTDSLTFHHHGGDQPAAERSRGQLPLMD